MMKKLTAVMVFMVSAAWAQAASVGVGVGVSSQGQAAPGSIASPGMPITDSGFIQFNNLTVESVSATNPPAEILATNPAIVPMIYNSTNANSATAVTAGGTCYRYGSADASAGTPVACPVPPAAASPSAATNMPMIPASGTMPTPTIYPTPPIRTQAYRIEVDASTKLYLRDRTVATLSNFAAGDEINVFGYYNADGSVQAYLVRDLSKPAQDEFIQLNNVNLISISASTTPTTLVVAQQTIYPCYGFGTDGNTKQTIACPLGASSAASNSTLGNVQVPSALMPIWSVARKYVVNIDAQTILLDSNRTPLQLSNLQIGDQLNIYGDTNDNGQTLNADIVRDLSIPATAQSYNGTVTQVNADGSFVFQTSDGRMITVQSPIQAGATLTLTGVLDRLSNVLSQVTSIISGSSMPPLPASAPGQLRIKGGPMLPPTASGTPNTAN